MDLLPGVRAVAAANAYPDLAGQRRGQPEAVVLQLQGGTGVGEPTKCALGVPYGLVRLSRLCSRVLSPVTALPKDCPPARQGGVRRQGTGPGTSHNGPKVSSQGRLPRRIVTQPGPGLKQP